MSKKNKLWCNIILKNNDIYLKIHYNTTEIKLKDIIVYVLNYENNDYVINPLLTVSTKSLKHILKKFGFTQLEIETVETIHRFGVVDYSDLSLTLKDNPNKKPNLSINEYLNLKNPLQKEIYELLPKKYKLQHKLNFIAHLLRTYKHTIIQATAAAYIENSQSVTTNNIDDIINLLQEYITL